MYAHSVRLFFLARYDISFWLLRAQQNLILCANPPKSTGVQNTSVDTQITLALTMGKIPRRRQLTGCRRRLLLCQGTSCSSSMHLTSATMGARACILATQGKMKTAAALKHKSCHRPSQLRCCSRSTSGDALPMMHLFMVKLISVRPTLYGTLFTALRRCACVRRLGGQGCGV